DHELRAGILQQVEDTLYQGLARQLMQHFRAPRAHSRPLAGGEHRRDQGAGTWRLPHVSLCSHEIFDGGGNREICLYEAEWLLAGAGCPARIRTWITTSKVWCPTIGRPGTAGAGRA